MLRLLFRLGVLCSFLRLDRGCEMMVSPLSILDKAASRCVQFSSAYCFLQRFERHQSLLIACAAYNNNNNISLDFFCQFLYWL